MTESPFIVIFYLCGLNIFELVCIPQIFVQTDVWVVVYSVDTKCENLTSFMCTKSLTMCLPNRNLLF